MPPEYFEEEEFETQYNGKTMLRTLGMLRPHFRYVAAFLVATLAVAGMDALFTYVSKLLVDQAIIPNDQDALVRYLTYYGGLTIFQAIMVFCLIYLVSMLGERLRFDLRQRMFNHLQDLSLSYYSRTPVGWIMARVTSDSDRVAELMTWGLMDSAWAVMSVTTSLVFMLIIDWRLALIVLALLPIMFYIAFQFRKRILGEFRNVRKTNSKITGSYNENITGVRVVKALGRQEENLREFGMQTGEMYRASYRAAWLSALFLPSVQMITALALGAIVWYGGLQAQIGAITVGTILAFVSYTTFMMWPIQDLAR
ncbi:MAG: ABC transporter ATP-binding protein, partial [Chloroflexi bacterium]